MHCAGFCHRLWQLVRVLPQDLAIAQSIAIGFGNYRLALCRVLPQALQSRQELSRLSLTAMRPMKCPCQSPGTAASTPSRSWLYCAAFDLTRYFDVLILHFGSNQSTHASCCDAHPACNGAAFSFHRWQTKRQEPDSFCT